MRLVCKVQYDNFVPTTLTSVVAVYTEIKMAHVRRLRRLRRNQDILAAERRFRDRLNPIDMDEELVREGYRFSPHFTIKYITRKVSYFYHYI